jgi:uncharacterized membrane protein HdeD (DUF308 family)
MSTSSLQTIVASIKHWYIPLIIGVVLILSGILVFSTPAESYLTLSVMFSLSFLLAGILQIVFSLANSKELSSWGWYLAGGILYMLIGILLLSRPEISIVTLPFLVGFFVLYHSVNALGGAYDLKNLGVQNWGALAIIAVLGIIFSFILIWNPAFAGLSLVFWTGMSFISAGVAAIYISLQLKKIKNLPAKISDELHKRINPV